METQNKPDRKIILGLTPAALWCHFPLVTIGIASLVGWIYKMISSFLR